MDKPRKSSQVLPYFVEFVKFSIGFAVIVAIALFALRFTGL